MMLDDPWPELETIINNVMDEEAMISQKLCVLLSTGSFNPVHKGHISMMTLAKKELEELHGYRCLRAFLSPSHDEYLSQKTKWQKKHFAAGGHRINMLSASIQEDNLDSWLGVSPFEINAKQFINFDRVALDLKHFIETVISRRTAARVNSEQNTSLCAVHSTSSTAIGDPVITVFYVCGTDLAENCGLCRGFPSSFHDGLGVIIVPRTGEVQGNITNPDRLVYEVVTRQPTEDLSSTSAQAYFTKKAFANVEILCGTAVVNYCVQNELYGLHRDSSLTSCLTS